MGALEYYTYADYVKWEGNWELIFGSPYAMAPSPIKSHQAIAYAFAFELSKSVQKIVPPASPRYFPPVALTGFLFNNGTS